MSGLKSPVELFKPDATLEARGNWDTKSILMIMEAARTGHYALEGKGTTRSFLNLDDLIFLPAQIARMPLLENEEVKCKVILGKNARKPIIANTPILNAGMSFGALSKEAKMALAKGSAMVGGVANTGDKIGQLREMTEGKPIALKMVGEHIERDLTAVFNQPHIPDVLVIDGGEGGFVRSSYLDCNRWFATWR